MASVGDFFSGTDWGGLFLNVGIGAVSMVLIAGVIIGIVVWTKNKKTYIYPVSLIVMKENGSHKRRDDLRGGLVKQRNGVTDFVIKIPRSYKKKKLGYVPNFSLTDANDRVVFLTSGDGIVWQQCAETLVTNKEVEFEVIEGEGDDAKTVNKKMMASLIIEPIPIDIKHVTINNIQAAESILEGNKLKATALIVGGFILMVMVQLIFLFLVA
ncbi:hypothetical protein LCGC14_0732210, partial [marine sediment metagenome]